MFCVRSDVTAGFWQASLHDVLVWLGEGGREGGREGDACSCDMDCVCSVIICITTCEGHACVHTCTCMTLYLLCLHSNKERR